MTKTENGRSTLEMIGVLVVFVFLTIGGFQVYSGVQSSLLSAHLEEEVLKEATIKKHENAKADDTDAHKVSHQGAHNTKITSKNGTNGTKAELFWVTISEIDLIAEQKACQKLLNSAKITEQAWLGLMAIEVNGQIVQECPKDIETITYYFKKRTTLNLENILLDNSNCPTRVCPTHATCVTGQITTCEAGYKISSNRCECVKCTGRFICDGVNEQECDAGTKPNANHTQCDPCAVGAKDALCCPNGAVVSNENSCDCEDYSDCPSDFVCVEGICTCQNQAECPLCKDASKKCWDAAQKQCISCPPSSYTTQDTCEQNGFQWCEAVEECKLKTDECPECDEHTDCSNATPKCNTATQTCEACSSGQRWDGSECVQCTADSDCSAGQYCNSNGSCANCAKGKQCRCTYCSNGSGSCQTDVQWCQWKYGTNFNTVSDSQCVNHHCDSVNMGSPWSCSYTVGSGCDDMHGTRGDNYGWNCYQFGALDKTCN